MRAGVAAALCACAGGQACVYGQTTFLAGGGSAGGIAVGVADGVGSSAMMNYPSGLSICEATGILYSPDYPFSRIRAVAVASAPVTTLAGGGAAGGTTAGSVDGVGTVARFNWPWGVAVTPAGDTVFVEEKWVPFFKTGKELRERLNPDSHDEEDDS